MLKRVAFRRHLPCVETGASQYLSLASVTCFFFLLRCRRLEGHLLQVSQKQNKSRGFFFYYPRLLYYLDQMLVVMVLRQHQILSCIIVRPHAPCGGRCMGHAIRTWSTVCSEAPHSQFGEGARPHLCMDEWNRTTLFRRRLSLT